MLALPILTLYLANPAAAAPPSGLRPDQETQRQYLSGTDKDHTVPWRFFCTAGAQSGYWTNIAVPSNWELQGFGTLSYQNDPTNVPVEQGKYEHTFTVPANWAGSRIFLVFEGAMTDTAATINGQPVGPIHQGSFYRFKYEVTKIVKTGESNRLEVTVATATASPTPVSASFFGNCASSAVPAKKPVSPWSTKVKPQLHLSPQETPARSSSIYQLTGRRLRRYPCR
jgi:hypothetical protein